MADPKPMQKLRIVNQNGEETTFVCKDKEVRDALTDAVNVVFDDATLSVSGSKQDGYTVGVPTFAGPDTIGLVPKPVASDADKFLRADGTWAKVNTSPAIPGFISSSTSIGDDGILSISCHSFTNAGTVPAGVDTLQIRFDTLVSMQGYMPDGIAQFAVGDNVPTTFEIYVDSRKVAYNDSVTLQEGKLYQVHLFNGCAIVYEFSNPAIKFIFGATEQHMQDLTIGIEVENAHDVDYYDLSTYTQDGTEVYSSMTVYKSDVDNGSITVTPTELPEVGVPYIVRVTAYDSDYNELDHGDTTVTVVDAFTLLGDVALELSLVDNNVTSTLPYPAYDAISSSDWAICADGANRFSISYANGPHTDAEWIPYNNSESSSPEDGFFHFDVGDDLVVIDGDYNCTLPPGDATVVAKLYSKYGAVIQGSASFRIADPLENIGDSWQGNIYYTVDSDDHLILENYASFDDNVHISEMYVIINGGAPQDISVGNSYVDLTDAYGISPENVDSLTLRLVSENTTYPSTSQPYKYSVDLSIPKS